MEIIFLLIGIVGGGATSFYMMRSRVLEDAGKGERLLSEAEKEAKLVREESAQRVEELKKAMETEEKSNEESLKKLEEMVGKKEEIWQRYEDRNKQQQTTVSQLKTDLEDAKKNREILNEKIIAELGKRSGLNKETALKVAQEQLDELIMDGAERHTAFALEELTEDAPKHAKAILQLVLQRLGVQSSVDKNNTSIAIKDDKFKGLLIGKNGDNARFFESLLPVSLIFNFGDPETLHIGGVNLLRRNMAKRAVDKLQTLAKKKGNLNQADIKSVIEESEKEILALCDKKGSESLKLLGLDPKDVPAELMNYAGRLYYRTSYGQNVMSHSNEMAFAARMIAELIGADTNAAMQAAFYHDIGKAIDHDVGGAHDDLSKEILEKHGYDPRIVHAAFAHHDKVPCETPEDYIVKAADAISGGRPGARQESVTNYFERIQQLENAALSFPGVQKVFAMSAGRELRLIVDKDNILDEGMEKLAGLVAEKISDEVAFPGVIKVNLIRLTKAVDYAREMNTGKRPTRKS